MWGESEGGRGERIRDGERGGVGIAEESFAPSRRLCKLLRGI